MGVGQPDSRRPEIPTGGNPAGGFTGRGKGGKENRGSQEGRAGRAPMGRRRGGAGPPHPTVATAAARRWGWANQTPVDRKSPQAGIGSEDSQEGGKGGRKLEVRGRAGRTALHGAGAAVGLTSSTSLAPRWSSASRVALSRAAPP